MDQGLRFRLLGPVEAAVGGQRVPIDRPRQRAVLAYLLLHANRLVTTESLVEAMWGGCEPGTARTQVQTDLSIIRRVLRRAGGDDPITTRPSGYVITCLGAQLDLDEFSQYCRSAEGMTDPAAAIATLRRALRLWRGQALADVTAAYVEAARGSLEEQRLQAYERLFSWELEHNHPGAVVAELTGLVDAHPTHERLVGQLMVALYHSGRQAEALHVARSLRRTLADELGIEPGPELRELERAILCNDRSLARSERAATSGTPQPRDHTAPAPALLPPDIADFVGRAEDQRRLDGLLPDADATTAAVVAVCGPPGVGKTALAIHWGHRVADRFPDGQLYLDLRGYSTDPPVPPAEALTRFLRALGMPADRIPHDVDDLAAAYRTRLAGRRMLIVADNAYHVDQVRPLLPAAPGCLCLVTSRSQLGGLVALNAARPVALDVLANRDAEAVLAQIIGVERAGSEPAALSELATACGHLPLALRIAAAQLALDPELLVCDLVGRMVAGQRLSTLAIADDPRASVRTAFDDSYRALPADLRGTFRRLGLVPGVDISVAAVAALDGVDDDTAAVRMVRLAATHLAEPRSGGRYAVHDLLREYAAEIASTEDSGAARDAAIDRLLAWQVVNADAANSAISEPQVRLELPGELTAQPITFADRAQALAWLNHERANLVATVHFAADSDRAPVAWLLADRLRGYLRRGGHLGDWIEIGNVAAESARSAPPEQRYKAEALMEFGLGRAFQTIGQTGEAAAHYQASIAAATRAEWLEVAASATGGVGVVAFRLGDLPDAAEHLRRAVELARQAGAPAVEANNLGNLALVTYQMGRTDEAAAALEAVIPLFRRIGSAHGEAQATNNLADTYLRLGRLDEAARSARQAVALFHEIGDSSEASARSNLALIHSRQGRLADALPIAQEALAMARARQHRYLESDCLMILAGICGHLGQHDLAIALAEQSLQLGQELGSASHAVMAGTTLAEVLLGAGRCDQARTQALAARELAQQRCFISDECVLTAVLAEIELAAGARAAASGYAQEAVTRGQAMALRPIIERGEAVLRALPDRLEQRDRRVH